MKLTVRLAALALASVAFAGTVSAQDAASTPPAAAGAHHRGGDPQQQLAHLTKQLQLSPDQVAKIQPILQNRQQQVEALRSDSSVKGPDRRAKMMSIMQDTDTQVQAVLTDSQRQQYQQWREKAMQHRIDKHPGDAGSN